LLLNPVVVKGEVKGRSDSRLTSRMILLHLDRARLVKEKPVLPFFALDILHKLVYNINQFMERENHEHPN
jgi:hypothetical protein